MSMDPDSRMGAHQAVQAIRKAASIGQSQAPGFERGSIVDEDLRLQPDTWSGEPFWPSGAQTMGNIGYDMAWHLMPDMHGELALEGVVDTGDNANGQPLEHYHPTRKLAKGDRVLMVWVRGAPVVLEILSPPLVVAPGG